MPFQDCLANAYEENSTPLQEAALISALALLDTEPFPALVATYSAYLSYEDVAESSGFSLLDYLGISALAQRTSNALQPYLTCFSGESSSTAAVPHSHFA